MQNWIFALMALTAVFAAVAAVANLFQAKRSAEANEVNVYIEMQKVYSSEAMRTAILELALFWRTHKDRSSSIADTYGAETKSAPENAKTLHGYSRLLSSYFVNAARLYETGLISRKLLRALISQSGLNVFYVVAIPINRFENEYHNSSEYESLLRGIVPRHGAGIF